MKVRKEAKAYVGIHFFPAKPFGTTVDGWRNENIESTTFPDESFDLVLSLDGSEHVFHPDRKFQEYLPDTPARRQVHLHSPD